MSYLSNFSIKLKVLILFLLPTVALMYQVVSIAVDKNNLVDESKYKGLRNQDY